jgi:predicted GNAT superfamily acetyltransferase
MAVITLRILETPGELAEVEALQRVVWPGADTEAVPVHMLTAAVHGGGLVVGAYEEDDAAPRLVGFVFGFPGIYKTADGPRLKHYSHMLGVHPAYRDQGLGFRLKRAQWQMVRRQGIDRITWTYDPLLSRNAYLNIARLGAVCNTYWRDFYGAMPDGLNAGLPSDRFEVDWWVGTRRVQHKLSRQRRRELSPRHYLAAELPMFSPLGASPAGQLDDSPPLALVEVPSDFQALRRTAPELARRWRLGSRDWFEAVFERGYLVTDFVVQTTPVPRSFYVLTHGEAQL